MIDMIWYQYQMKNVTWNISNDIIEIMFVEHSTNQELLEHYFILLVYSFKNILFYL